MSDSTDTGSNDLTNTNDSRDVGTKDSAKDSGFGAFSHEPAPKRQQ